MRNTSTISPRVTHKISWDSACVAPGPVSGGATTRARCKESLLTSRVCQSAVSECAPTEQSESFVVCPEQLARGLLLGVQSSRFIESFGEPAEPPSRAGHEV